MRNTLTEMNIMKYCDVAEDLYWFLSSKCKLKVFRKKEIKAVVNHACCRYYPIIIALTLHYKVQKYDEYLARLENAKTLHKSCCCCI